jgi:protein TonB
LIIGVVVVVVGLAAFFFRDRWLPTSTAAKTTAVTGRPLQVDVETAGLGLVKVRWNPQSVPVTQAREGRLVISEDNQQPRTVPLAPDQLKTGHLDYQSAANRIEFRLEVVDRSGAVAKESVLALSSKPGATPPDTTPSQTTPQVAPPPAEKNVPKVEAKVNPPQVEKAPDPPQASRPAPREFTPPPTTQRPTEDVRTVVLDAPVGVPVASVVKPVSGLPDRMPSVPAPQAQQPAGGQAPPVGGNLQEPKLTKKIAPAYPSLARSLRIEGSVRFTATVRRDGTVANIQLVSGHKMLVQAATDAVRQWVYRPAVLNGKPVEVTTQIDVKFTLNE